MGLIRKTLAVGTLGTVKGSSKKQRTAKATLQEIQRQNAILDGSAARAEAAAAASRFAKMQRKASREQEKAIGNLRKQQARVAGDPSVANLSRLREAEKRVRRAGLQVTQAPK
jgi:hypothetical protein